MKSLIISPQAGFANRLRTICSAKILGNLLCRKVYHYWVEDEVKSLREHVNEMKAISMSYLFDTDIPLWDGKEIDMCFSEWVEGDGWFLDQSTAIRKLKTKSIQQFTTVDEVINCDAETILIESSIELVIPGYENWEEAMIKTYQESFKLTPLWQSVYDTLPQFDWGISIRRGDFLLLFPETEQPFGEIVNQINSLDGSKFITGDDPQFISEVRKATKSFIKIEDFIHDTDFTFVQFLLLAKCKQTMGTKKSAFIKQASLYGDNKYSEL